MATYEHEGIRFQYPENWTLDDAEAVGGDGGVTVYSPSGAFWSLIWRDLAEDPQDLAVEALNTLKQEYAETEAEPATETIAGRKITGFDVSFYFVDLISTAVIRGFRTMNASCLVLAQAEDREFRQLEIVFQAMTTSLLTSSR